MEQKKSLLLIIKKTNTIKKYIIASIIALVAVVTIVNVYQTNNEFNLSNLALANVEALAENEGPDYEVVCGSKEGPCWVANFYVYHNCGEYTMVHPCQFDGSPLWSCYDPCSYQ